MSLLEKIREKAKRADRIQEWIYLPAERRSAPLGGAYDTELTETRQKALWVPFDDVEGVVGEWLRTLQGLWKERPYLAEVTIKDRRVADEPFTVPAIPYAETYEEFLEKVETFLGVGVTQPITFPELPPEVLRLGQEGKKGKQQP